MQGPQQMNDYGEQQRVAVLMEMNFKRLFKEIQEVRQMVENLQNTPAPMVRGTPSPDPPVQIVQEREPVVQQEAPRHEAPRAPPVQTTFQQAPPKEKPYSQRVGEWKPEDVSIEKFFYAGGHR